MRLRLLAICLLLGICGCQPSTPPEPEPLRAKAERGPFRFRIEFSPPSPSVGDPITIRLTARTPTTHVVRFPQDEAFEPLEVFDVRLSEQESDEAGVRIWQRTLQAESFTSGSLEIAPLVLTYGTEASDGSFEPENELALDSFPFEVRSALTSQDTVATPRDISGTRLTPEPPWTWQQWSIALGSLLIALALLTWLGRIIWQQTHRPAPPIPPEVQARDALRPLQDEQWLAPEKLKEYHYRLSEVVRTYVEQQFGVAAPDMTTEEFLRVLSSSHGGRISDRFQRGAQLDQNELRFLLQQIPSLQGLLEGCDLVKYGQFAPSSDQARDSWTQASTFVDSTASELQVHRARQGEEAPA